MSQSYKIQNLSLLQANSVVENVLKTDLKSGNAWTSDSSSMEDVLKKQNQVNEVEVNIFPLVLSRLVVFLSIFRMML